MNASLFPVLFCLALVAGCTAQNADNEKKDTRPAESPAAEQPVAPPRPALVQPQAEPSREEAAPNRPLDTAATVDQSRIKAKTEALQSYAGAAPAALTGLADWAAGKLSRSSSSKI